MEKQDLRIIYMGTPDFAVESLKRLVEGGYNVVLLLPCLTNRPAEATKIQYSPVKEYALSRGLPILQPEKLKDECFIEQLRELHADLQIVVAFRMLPEIVWNMPRLGDFQFTRFAFTSIQRSRSSQLGYYQRRHRNRITTSSSNTEIDTGRIIQQRRIPILPEDNVGTIHDKLMTLGADMVVETVDAIISGNITPIDQASIQTNEPLRPAAQNI